MIPTEQITMDGAQETVVTTTAGTLRGLTDGVVDRFLGVPYGEAPVGRLRFVTPEPRRPWSGVMDALEPTNAPQNVRSGPLNPLGRLHGEQTADALRLNVWAPHGEGAPRPVLVFLHGGAWVGGSPSNPLHDGTAFARDGVVVVQPAYRLGIEGFLCVDDRIAEASGTGDLGAWDIVLALEWVRENIAAFGGDPDNVTLGGVSAGAMTVSQLMGSPRTAGLFRRAICESGALQGLSREGAGRITDLVFELLGESPRSLDELRAIDPDRLRAVQGTVFTGCFADRDRDVYGEAAASGMPFQPVFGTELLPLAPAEAIRGGAARQVELLTGTNADEYEILLQPASAGVSRERTIQQLRELDGFSASRAGAIVDHYEATVSRSDDVAIAAAIDSDRLFGAPVRWQADAQAALGAPVFVYEFSWPSAAEPGAGQAHHFLELPFVFDALDSEDSRAMTGVEAPAALAGTMHAAWTGFITSGEPRVGDVRWPPYSPTDRAVMTFPSGTATSDPRSRTLRLWSDP